MRKYLRAKARHKMAREGYTNVNSRKNKASSFFAKNWRDFI